LRKAVAQDPSLEALHPMCRNGRASSSLLSARRTRRVIEALDVV
jgi:hypothetical protein